MHISKPQQEMKIQFRLWLVDLFDLFHKGDVIDQRGGTGLVFIPDFHVGFERLGILWA